MPKNNVLTQEDFDALLKWFAADREKAGAKYEEIRSGLIRYFYFKGCSEAEILADETINRVARKLSALDRNNTYKPITYFYGFASKIYLEYRNSIKIREVEFEQNLHPTDEKFDVQADITENRHKCLEECLAQLSLEERELAIGYFSKEKSEKFENRRELAEKMDMTMTALYVRIFRLKSVLRNCVENCLKRK